MTDTNDNIRALRVMIYDHCWKNESMLRHLNALAEEIARLRLHQTTKCGTCGRWMPAGAGICWYCECMELRQQLAAQQGAVEDTKRLDWLDSWENDDVWDNVAIEVTSGKFSGVNFGNDDAPWEIGEEYAGHSIREAIDAAIRARGEK